MKAGRVLSLDVFRGLTVAAMVLVNNPGSWRHVYWPLQHAEWHGWTPTDLVFPFFLFIVGVAIPLGLGRRLEEGASRGGLALRILATVRRHLRARAVSARGAELRPGHDPDSRVLQRIAVCYLAAALLFLVSGWRTEVVIAAAAVLGYWAALELVPVPGLGAGNLDREGNVAAWLDRLVLGPHIWRIGRVYDPEGILSTVPAIATTLFGVLAGRLVRSGLGTADTATGLFVGGAVGIGLGLAWEPWLPMNKALWTGSYAVFTAGAAWMVLAVGYWLIEVRGRGGGRARSRSWASMRSPSSSSRRSWRSS